jgi:hypothetical protein
VAATAVVAAAGCCSLAFQRRIVASLTADAVNG